MPLAASGVNLLDPLKDPLSKVGQRTKGTLQSALGGRQAHSLTSQDVSGRPQGGYAEQELQRAFSMGNRGIEDSLYGVLGNASLKDLQSQKEFERNRLLAEDIGDMLKPSVFNQVISGLSGGADLAMRGKGVYDALGSNAASYGSGGPANTNLLSRTHGWRPNPDEFDDERWF